MAKSRRSRCFCSTTAGIVAVVDEVRGNDRNAAKGQPVDLARQCAASSGLDWAA